VTVAATLRMTLPCIFSRPYLVRRYSVVSAAVCRL